MNRELSMRDVVMLYGLTFATLASVKLAERPEGWLDDAELADLAKEAERVALGLLNARAAMLDELDKSRERLNARLDRRLR